MEGAFLKSWDEDLTLRRYDLEECCDFSRHSGVKTMMIYRKRKKNVQGDLSELLAAAL